MTTLSPIVIGPQPPPAPPPEPTFPTWRFRPMTADEEWALARASSVNSVGSSAQKRQLTLAAENSPLRLTYGEDRLGAQIVNLLQSGSTIYVQCLWGYGGDGVSEVKLNDADLPTGSVQRHYDGTQSAVDTNLAAAFAAQSPSITYSDTLAGFQYSVLEIPAAQFTGGLSITGLVRGRKVYDPRTTSTVWSDNPALCLRDFLTDTDYGAGRTVDDSTVTTLANLNDTLLVDEKHRLIGWTLSSVQSVSAILDTLRTYAGCFIVRDAAQFRLVADAPGSSVATYAHASGDIQSFSAVEKADVGSLPTRVEVVYTETDQTPWRDRSAYAVLAGETIQRLQTVRLNGIKRYSQARREAVERLNKMTLADVSVQIVVFDRGMAHEAGVDIVTVTLPTWGSAKEMRVTDVESAGPGLWKLALAEYQPGMYSTEVQAAPTYGDTDLPLPGSPPSLDGLVAAYPSGEVYQNENGLFISRALVTITPPSYPWIAGYQIEMYTGGQLVHSGFSLGAIYRSPPVQDLTTYTVQARVLSTIGATGAWGSDSFTADGKQAIPGNVASISAFEVGGDVYLAWTAAVDVDIWRYELRWGASGVSWADAMLLDRVDSLRYVSKGVLTAGVRKVMVKAIDSIGQYSTTEASTTVTVTIDPDALQTDYAEFGTGTAGNPAAPVDMTTTKWGPDGATYYVTEHGVVMSNAAMFGGYTVMGDYSSGAMAARQADATNTYYTDPWDAGVDLTGDWTCSIDVANTSGAATISLWLEPAAGGGFTEYTTFPVKTTARHAYVTVSGTNEFTVLPTSASVTCYAVTKREYGQNEAIGASGTTITLDGSYFAHRSIIVTPRGSSGLYATVDAISLDPTGATASTFKIYLFDSGGLTTGNVDWKFEGV